MDKNYNLPPGTTEKDISREDEDYDDRCDCEDGEVKVETPEGWKWERCEKCNGTGRVE